ncbi:MAG: pantetheine-phosphate adenylyltransferase [Anaplasmataceae bacterium]|nr:pantetheine-phosphate adenylyltransferase [Anaplasmataceae bacterium]
MARIAVYPGTFDPVTLGHLDIIKKSLLIFDKLYIGVVDDNSLGKNVLFTSKERKEMIDNDVRDFHSVEVHIFSGLLVDFMESVNANFIIRGVRTITDLEYEFNMNYINKMFNNKIETIFLPAELQYQMVSSTAIKKIAHIDQDIEKISQFTSRDIAEILIHKIQSKF